MFLEMSLVCSVVFFVGMFRLSCVCCVWLLRLMLSMFVVIRLLWLL